MNLNEIFLLIKDILFRKNLNAFKFSKKINENENKINMYTDNINNIFN